MKFAAFALIATVSAVQIETPKESYAAKAESLKEVLATVAEQHRFEAEHAAMHAANMAKADADQEAEQKRIREARIYALQHSWMKE